MSPQVPEPLKRVLTVHPGRPAVGPDAREGTKTYGIEVELAMLERVSQRDGLWYAKRADIKFRHGDLIGAKDSAVLAAVHALGDGHSEALSSGWRVHACSLLEMGEYAAAKELCRQMAALAQSQNQVVPTAHYFEVRGWYLLRTGSYDAGDYALASDAFRQALELYEDASDLAGMFRAQEGLASSLAGEGQYMTALDWVDEGLRLGIAFNDPRTTHRFLLIRALAMRDTGYRQPALAVFEDAIRWCRANGDQLSLAKARVGEAVLKGSWIEAVDDPEFAAVDAQFAESAELATRIEALPTRLEAFFRWADYLEKAEGGEAGARKRCEADALFLQGLFDAYGLNANREGERESTRHRTRNEVEDTLLGVIDATPDAHFVFQCVFHRDGEIADFASIYRNRSADRLFASVPVTQGQVESAQRMLSEFEGVTIFQGVHPALESVYRTGKMFEDEVAVASLGAKRWFARRAFATKNGATLSLRDVTAIHENRDLLEQVADEARSADLAKTELLATVSYDVRTPVTSILGLAKLLANSEMDPALRPYVAGILSQAEALQRILGDVLDLNQLESNRIDLQYGPTSLHRILHELAEESRTRMGDRTIPLEISVDRALPEWIEADGMRVRQVLAYLIHKSIESGDARGVRVSARLRDRSVRIEIEGAPGVQSADRYLRTTDLFPLGNGPSICADERIGMTISKRLVELMNGRLGFDAESDLVGRIWVELPFVPLGTSAVAQAGSEGNGEADLFAGFKVLVVEDNELNVIVIQDALESLGCRVDVVVDGAQAVDRVLHGQYALVLMDLYMPEMGGLEATRRIRSLETERRTPIVALTAMAVADRRDVCLAAGMDGFLPKPFTENALRNILRRLLVE